MKYALIAVALVIGGCATTPDAFRDSGRKFERHLTQPPGPAAGCAARNAENKGNFWLGPVMANARVGKTPGTWEVSIMIALVADIEPSGSGSIAKISASPYLLESRLNTFLSAFDGC